MTIPVAYERILKRWQNVVKVALQSNPQVYPEANLQSDLAAFIFQELGFEFDRIKQNHQIGSGLKADMVIYKDINQPPIMVVENKRLEMRLDGIKVEEFDKECRRYSLYKKAIGCASRQDNGIKQYLNIESVNPDCLASYGLVFNGIFFQLWRRVDGLVLPLTLIQKVTPTSLPKLLDQLQYCFDFPKRALVTAIWNQKGGVAKTTNTINVGATLAIANKKVLLIDLDPQSDITKGLNLKHKSYLKECWNLVQLEEHEKAKKILEEAIQIKKIPTTDKKNYSLYCLTTEGKILKDFRDFEDTITNDQKPGFFRELIHLVIQEYDYIFIDSSPSPDVLSRCMVTACDTVLIPVDYGKKSLDHGARVSQKIPDWRLKRNIDTPIPAGPWNLGIVFSNCPKDRGSSLETFIHKQISSTNFKGKQYKPDLQVYAQTKIAEYKHLPVVCWRNSPITLLYQQLVEKIFINPNFIDS